MGLAVYLTEVEGGNDLISLPKNQFMSPHLTSAGEQPWHRRTKDILKMTKFYTGKQGSEPSDQGYFGTVLGPSPKTSPEFKVRAGYGIYGVLLPVLHTYVGPCC